MDRVAGGGINPYSQGTASPLVQRCRQVLGHIFRQHQTADTHLNKNPRNSYIYFVVEAKGDAEPVTGTLHQNGFLRREDGSA